MRRGYLDGPWGQLHYRRAGESGPWIVLLHESPLSSAVYDLVLPLLGERARAVAVDTPGYGMSDPPPEPREIPEYADAILAGLDALGVDRFCPVGVHTGASIAVRLAVSAGPERVGPVVLSGVPVLDPERRAAFLADWAPETPPRADGGHLDWAWRRYQRIWGVDSPPWLLHLGATELLRALPRYHWAYNAAFRYDPAPDLPGLAGPVLLLTAEHDILVDSDRAARELLPAARHEIVPGLPGQLPLRDPEGFARAVLAAVGR